MKLPLTILFIMVQLIFIALNSSAQDSTEKKYAIYGIVPLEGDEVEYSGVVSAPDRSAKAIYDRIIFWAANSYKSAKDVTKLDNKDAGDFILKGYNFIGFTHPFYGYSYYAYHIIQIQFKDNKYRYNIRIPYLSTTPALLDKISVEEEARRLTKKNAKKMLTCLDNSIKELIASLKVEILKNVNDNW